MAGTNVLVWVLLGGCVVALGACVVGGPAVVVRGKVEIARIHAGAAGRPRKG
ncbi:hypothetical protein ACF09J_28190 [Streptomyces sp. NPDC014889]|uniref:hypothetical protein n=1 Tax=Streptomyces sp. NPDC014889 TaxID=3364928 RepID=UPI0036F5311D